MSQTVCFVKINDVLYPEVFPSLPDKEAAIAFIMEIVKGEELKADSEYEMSSIWYEIGEGESGTDEFFTDKELIFMCKNGDYNAFEKNIKEQGYEPYSIQEETISVSYREIKE